MSRRSSILLGSIPWLIALAGVGGGAAVYFGWLERPGKRPAATESPAPTPEALRKDLQKACAGDDLRGVWIRTARIDGDKLSLECVVDHPGQATLVKERAHKLLAASPGLEEKCRGGVQVSVLARFPARGTYLPVLQAAFARGEAGSDTAARRVFRRTRLDDVFHDEKGDLHLAGVCIDPGAQRETVAGGTGSSARAIKDAVEDFLKKQPGGERAFKAVKMEIVFDRGPGLVLGPLVRAEPGLKGAFLGGASYDEGGTLQFNGILADERQRAKLQALVERKLAGSPVVRRGKDGRLALSLRPLRVLTESALLARLRTDFAGHARPLFRRTRLDGVRFTTSAEGAPLALAFQGVCIHGGNARELLDELTRQVTTEVGRLLPGLGVQLDFGGVHFRGSLLPRIQQQIAAAPDLEGVEADVAFDTGGKLVVSGFLGTPKQQAAVEGIVRKALADVVNPGAGEGGKEEQEEEEDEEDKEDKPAPGPAPTIRNKGSTGVKEFREALQARFATGADALLRQTRLDRGTFVGDFVGEKLNQRLSFRGICLHPGSADVLHKRLVDVLGREWRKFNEARPEQEKKGLPLDVEVKDIVCPGDPCVPLRRATLTEPRLAGSVFVEAAYGKDGSFQLRGLLAARKEATLAEQRAAARTILEKAFGKEFGIGKLFRRDEPPNLEGLKLLPADLVVRLQARVAGRPEAATPPTRLDQAVFRYEEEKDALTLRLRVKGVALLPGRGDPKRHQEEGKKLAAALETLLGRDAAAVLPELRPDSYKVAVDSVAVEASPVPGLQALAVRKRLDGLLFVSARYDATGRLQLEALAPHDELKKAAAALLEANPLAPPLVSADEARAKPQLTVGRLDWQGLVKDWPALLRDLQGQLAASSESSLRQTRIDRIYFTYANDGAERRLHFHGVCIHAPGNRDKLKASLAEACRKQLPRPGYEVVVEGVESHPSPLPKLAALARDDDALEGVLFQGAVYDAAGKLQLSGRFGPEQKQAIENMIRKKLAADPVFFPPQRSTSPGEKGASFSLERMTPFDWPRLMRRLRAALAAADQPLLRQTRIDRAYFLYDHDKKRLRLRLRFEGVCIPTDRTATNAARLERLGQRLSGLVPGVEYVPDVAVVFHDSPVFALQAEGLTRKLDGLLFEEAIYEADGALRLKVMLPPAAPPDTVASVLRNCPLPNAVLRRAGAPARRPAVTTRTFDWPDMLKGLRGRLAGSRDALSRQTRVDRATFTHDRKTGQVLLALEGVSLIASGQGEKELKERLAGELKGLVPGVQYLPSLAKVDFKPSPVYLLQEEALAQKLDGLLFEEARYDAGGSLRVDVLLADAGQKKPAEDILARHRPRSPVLLPGGVAALEARVLDWPMTLKRFQAALAGSGRGELRMARLDRAYFSYPARKPTLSLRIEALYLNPQTAQATPRLEQFLGEVAKTVLSPQLRSGRVAVTMGLRAARNPAPALQARVVARKLDGVWVQDAGFDAEGNLTLSGLWLGRHQTAALEELLKKEAPEGLLRGPVSWLGMRDVPSDQVLLRLRKWVEASAELEEVSLERLFFDETGRLVIQGTFTRAGDKEKVARGVLEILRSSPLRDFVRERGPRVVAVRPARGGWALASPLPAMFTAAPQPNDPLDLTKVESLTDYLRVSVPLDSRLDGVRVDRCYYDTDGKFVITGLADSERQLPLLGALLATPEVRQRVARQLRKGWRAGAFTLLPLRPMLDCLARVQPDYELLDGLRLTRAYHDAGGRLAFAGALVGNVSRQKAERLLADLFRDSLRWRVRASAGLTLAGLRAVPADARLASEALNKALVLLRTGPPEVAWSAGPACFGPARPVSAASVGGGMGWTEAEVNAAYKAADTVLLHRPGDSTARFLRALCMAARKDRARAERDLRRMVLAENADPTARIVRMRDLEGIQGPLRIFVGESSRRLEEDVARGGPLLTLADCR